MGRQGVDCQRLVQQISTDYERKPFVLRVHASRLNLLSVDEALERFYCYLFRTLHRELRSLVPFVKADFLNAFSDTYFNATPDDALLIRWLFPTRSPVHALLTANTPNTAVCQPTLLHKTAVFAIPVNETPMGNFHFYRSNPTHIAAKMEDGTIKRGLHFFQVELADTLKDVRDIANRHSSVPSASRHSNGSVQQVFIHIDAEAFTPFRSLRRSIVSDPPDTLIVATKLAGHPLLREGLLRFGVAETQLSRHLPSALKIKFPISTMESLLQCELLHFSHSTSVEHPFDPEPRALQRVASNVQLAAGDIDVTHFIESDKRVLRKLGVYDVVRSRHDETNYAQRLQEFHHAWDWTHALDLAAEISRNAQTLRSQQNVFEAHRRLLLLIEQTFVVQLRAEYSKKGITLPDGERHTASNLASHYLQNSMLSDVDASIRFWRVWLSSAAKSQKCLRLEMLVKAYLRKTSALVPAISILDRRFRRRPDRIRQENEFALGRSSGGNDDRLASLLAVAKLLVELRNFFMHGEEEISVSEVAIRNTEFWLSEKRLPTPERGGEYARDTPFKWSIRFAKSRGENPQTLFPKESLDLSSRLILSPQSAWMLERLYIFFMLGVLA